MPCLAPSTPAFARTRPASARLRDRVLALSLVALPLLALPVVAAAQEQSVSFIDTDGTEIGTAELTSTPNGVLIRVDLGSLPAKSWLGFHIHETADCDPETAFEGAGGHFNPSGVEHGLLTETGPHAGDMTNLYTDAEGRVQAETLNPYIRFDAGEDSIHGRALMIHSGPDDYQSQPSGDAGDRIACAPIP
ncbi:superoxide dismutase [Pararhodobacter marinus]|uniref:Superoxide dismutase [Cu-Zn] n=1 Tax=Pararhodobacter marinus TaxID=2184063 RepID=A0A2U2CIQ5_9RHOB|nr:superoxide dismutase family protein [Pararhodobacter marinus]PWE31731.1 superoxide dismutase [Pararhodobacter marinus]